MTQSVLTFLQKKGIIPTDEPMKPSQYDLRGGVPIIDISRNPRDQPFGFMLYSNVTSPDGRTLIQNEGTQYAVSINEDELQVVDNRKVKESLPFGLIGVHQHDYYLADRELVNKLESMCNKT